MNGKKRMAYLFAALVIVAIGCLGWKMTSRSAYESAEYKVLKSDGSFEVREYPDLTLVTTSMNSRSQGNDGSFGRLFRYISGENGGSRKVAMTTPVFMESTDGNSPGQMAFVIPRDVVTAGTPDPTSEYVRLRQRAKGHFAVLRFNGRMDDVTLLAMNDKLRVWMKGRGLEGEETSEFAGYDPPWTPGLFRRNEVLIRLK